jgi:RHS repeat-associated protein
VKATSNAVVSVTGIYMPPVSRQIPAGGGYLPAAGLETWLPQLPPTLNTWTWLGRAGPGAPRGGEWHPKLGGDLASVTDLPPTLNPGGALYVSADTAVELEIPAAALRIRYYHQDHLGSSSSMTDAEGALIEQTAFYPFGIPRHEHRLRSIEEHYKFTEKERDKESGLHYFEARYLVSQLSRFATPDPKYAHPDLLGDGLNGFLSAPQRLNLYAYVNNSPVRYVDPTGLERCYNPFASDCEVDAGEVFNVLWETTPLGIFEVGTFGGDNNLTQFVTAVGGEKAGTVARWAPDVILGGAGLWKHGVKGLAKEGMAFLKNPGAFVKETASLLKNDVAGVLKKSAPKITSVPVPSGGTLATASGSLPGGAGAAPARGGSIGTADTQTLGSANTLIPAAGGPKPPTMREINMMDPAKARIIGALEATAEARGRMSQEAAAEAVRKIFSGID